MSNDEIFRNIVVQRALSLKGFLQAFALCLIGVMWLQAGRSDLTANYQQIELSIPSYYIAFAVAMSFANGMLKLINYFFLNEFLRVACNKLFRFDNPLALSIAVDGTNAWNLPLWRQYRFFNSGARHMSLVKLSTAILLVPLLLLCVFILYVYFLSAYGAAISRGLISLSGVLCVSGTIMILFPFIYVIFLFLPLPFEKNPRYVRWNFLFRLYRRSGFVPDHVSLWLQ